MTDTLVVLDASGHKFTIFAALGFGIGITELVSHLEDDYRLIRDWKWAHISYFGARYSGISAMAGYLILACIGTKSNTTCHNVFIFTHIGCALLSLFSSSIFWTRCAALCEWRRSIVIPLALYGLAISGYTLAGAARNFQPRTDNTISPVCVVAVKALDEAICRFLFASFDLIVAGFTFWALWKKSSSKSWITPLLFQDQLLYITITMISYLGLACTYLTDSSTRRGFGLLCPTVIKGVNNPQNQTLPDLVISIDHDSTCKASRSMSTIRTKEYNEETPMTILTATPVTAQSHLYLNRAMIDAEGGAIHHEVVKPTSLSGNIVTRWRSLKSGTGLPSSDTASNNPSYYDGSFLEQCSTDASR